MATSPKLNHHSQSEPNDQRSQSIDDQFSGKSLPPVTASVIVHDQATVKTADVPGTEQKRTLRVWHDMFKPSRFSASPTQPNIFIDVSDLDPSQKPPCTSIAADMSKDVRDEFDPLIRFFVNSFFDPDLTEVDIKSASKQYLRETAKGVREKWKSRLDDTGLSQDIEVKLALPEEVKTGCQKQLGTPRFWTRNSTGLSICSDVRLKHRPQLAEGLSNENNRASQSPSGPKNTWGGYSTREHQVFSLNDHTVSVIYPQFRRLKKYQIDLDPSEIAEIVKEINTESVTPDVQIA